MLSVSSRKKSAAPALPVGPGADPAELASRLAFALPEPRCELDHKDPWTLLVATILSAQSTDRTVNTVTPLLFEKWPTPQALAAAPRDEVEGVVHRTGFFRNKAKAIQGASLAIAQQHGGQVPKDMAALVALPGVARKTANVVLGVAYRIAEGVVVDTHVGRLARRLGWTRHADPVKVEADLNALLPREAWVFASHALILHGRRVCPSRSPRCASCFLADVCPKVGVAPPKAAAGAAARKAGGAAGRPRASAASRPGRRPAAGRRSR